MKFIYSCNYINLCKLNISYLSETKQNDPQKLSI